MLHKLQGHYAEIPAGLRHDILAFYRNLDSPNTTKADPKAWAQVVAELGELRAVNQDLGVEQPVANSARNKQRIQEEKLMSFGIYLIGFLLVIGGLIYGASLMHIPGHWIFTGAIVLLGIGILSGVKATRQKDPS